MPEYGCPAEDQEPGVTGGEQSVERLPVPGTEARPGGPGDHHQGPGAPLGAHVLPGEKAVVQGQHPVVSVVLPVCQLGLS